MLWEREYKNREFYLSKINFNYNPDLVASTEEKWVIEDKPR